MARCPGVPWDPGPYPRGNQEPNAVIAHRTWGSWNGDYAVGKGARSGIGFHFLVGKSEGQWVQFYESNVRCNHAAGGNVGTIGIEVTGTDDDPMTDWQVRALGHICRWISDTHGIPLVKYQGGRTSTFHGWRDHADVAGSDHTDYWSDEDWQRIVAAAGGQEADDMFDDTARATLDGVAGEIDRIGDRQPWAFVWAGGLHTFHVRGDGALLHSSWDGTQWRVEQVGSGCDPTVEPVVIAEQSRVRCFCRSADLKSVVHAVYEVGEQRWYSAPVGA